MAKVEEAPGQKCKEDGKAVYILLGEQSTVAQ
jgi:hypothetical protein